MMVNRYLLKAVKTDLLKKMVFLGGARQVGKTTLALSLLPNKNESDPAYLNWDTPGVQSRLLRGELPGNQSLVILDEIHKYRKWRNLVKGLYDQYRSSRAFLVTGSARLDFYRRGGDSLQGRYHYYRLHPFSLPELSKMSGKGELAALLKFGGFPEPLFSQNEVEWKRWQRERQTRVIREDLLSLEMVKEVSQLDLLVSLLPTRVGSPLSINNLRNDLEVAFETIERWISILENLYYCFRISPYGPPKIKAVRKEQKLYLWDWSLIEDEGARFENFVASHLIKYCHFIEDTQGEEMELRFLKNDSKKEIDFVVLKNRKPQFAVECKSGNRKLSSNIEYYAARTSIPVFYQAHLGELDSELRQSRARILPFHRLCKEVGLV